MCNLSHNMHELLVGSRNEAQEHSSGFSRILRSARAGEPDARAGNAGSHLTGVNEWTKGRFDKNEWTEGRFDVNEWTKGRFDKNEWTEGRFDVNEWTKGRFDKNEWTKGHVVFWTVFIIATLAAIVGSQAIITATFSIVKQCHAHGFFPRV
ncbi:hypothetical protein HYC85_029198 [Camellia sinensis]|uniref:K+ potassium transporter integral membrane domain-containing protein n=1 Tax=Camellia sinensis TaxID=4442 RepID=A0A7J7FY02_CAMSI|nr:hypothetical protein HYC85_029198 [Camellia sinensis]